MGTIINVIPFTTPRDATSFQGITNFVRRLMGIRIRARRAYGRRGVVITVTVYGQYEAIGGVCSMHGVAVAAHEVESYLFSRIEGDGTCGFHLGGRHL